MPSTQDQIRQAHAGLIHRVVAAVTDPEARDRLEGVLEISERNGWTALVARVRRILAGARDESLLGGLDEEDRVIVTAILEGLQNPATLPPVQATADPSLAAPGIARMIHAAASGDVQALHLLSGMAEQMQSLGGDMARLAGAFRPLMNGERDPDQLCRGMTAHGEGLMLAILEELGRLRLQ
jgi:hypothetical protein